MKNIIAYSMEKLYKDLEEATGTEGISVRPNRGYIEKLQATIPSIDIRKKLAIRERLGGI